MPTTTIRERPIIFSAPMIRALLAGKKTQTRRLVKPQPGPSQWIGLDNSEPQQWWLWEGYQDESAEPIASVKCPFEIGMRLWVREGIWFHAANNLFYQCGQGRKHYDADLDDAQRKARRAEGWQRKPSIFMPRWASRLTLEISEVRVQRIGEIDAADAWAEGVRPEGVSEIAGDGTLDSVEPAEAVLRGFREAWLSIHGAGSLILDPWVWAVSLRVV